ncbi:hypothetical protein Kpol_460p4 [Vanderwaltozyma polyspora DSM 70294]|uniref:Uncharacterized protein n=1 Tax=Vanderwaltozyma polyspora (strain ATCC 22028 / DSM 70294 / BCRC 21397 / CBS 2163 / NBRC 10782 / NRRL Y-8283 / UCD 57-17) TaxID=436907 RepID=A7TQS0_VANPO|nr:uncharacterized protein Kpol_460p4 [Vanderwaltozyma polyspora DSM 70294]EDO15369.1 hypothetical protein Kpol_460p4 [Vanderwaltozyma polyspora DSM 70294]
MSVYGDELNQIFVQSIFPQYLLEQPIGQDLWLIYLKNKRLFSKVKQHEIKNRAQGGEEGALKEGGFNHPIKLSHNTRKEIWKKLMDLGVLGTVPFDWANDEYLIQVYKYFYPDSLINSLSVSIGADLPLNPSNNSSSNFNTVKNDVLEEFSKQTRLESGIVDQESIRSIRFRSDESEDDDSEDERVTSTNEEEEDDDEEEEEEEGEEEEEEENDAMDIDNDDVMNVIETAGSSVNDEDSDNIIIPNREDTSTRIRQRAGSETDRVSSRGSESEPVSYYPALSAHRVTSKSKNNVISQDIYELLGYPLPSQWRTQQNNSINLSSDGFSQLSPNLNWPAFSGHDNAVIIARNYFKDLLKDSKCDYAVSTANRPVYSNRAGIFYYEVRVLSVTSSQGAYSSDVMVGFKCWNDKDSEGSSSAPHHSQSGDDGISARNSGDTSVTRGSGRSGSIRSGNDASTSDATDLSNELYLYCGFNGKIFDNEDEGSYSKPFGRDDVIGCGVNYIQGTVFFTKNGVYLGEAYWDIGNLDLVPFIALRPGNSIGTNFGLYEEYVFDIVGYLERWRLESYSYIFKNYCSARDADGYNENHELETESSVAVSGKGGNTFTSSVDENNEESVGSQNRTTLRDYNGSGEDNIPNFSFKDDRLVNGILRKPSSLIFNKLKTDDSSLQTSVKTIVNDYLIQEGLIDVANAFLKDLKDETVIDQETQEEVDRNREVTRYNESQIIKEENNLKKRQAIRRLIAEGNITKCLLYLNNEYPELLASNIELYFELKLAEFLYSILNCKDTRIENTIQLGQQLSAEFIFNDNVSESVKNVFKTRFNDVSSLLAYEDPVKDAPSELTKYLTVEFLNDRLFQLTNSAILKYMKKNNETNLENIIRYTRAMLETMMNDNSKGGSVDGKSYMYYRAVNLDEDLLNFM